MRVNHHHEDPKMYIVYLRFKGNEGKPSDSVPGTATSKHVVDCADGNEAVELAYGEVRFLHRQLGEPEIAASVIPFSWSRATRVR